MSTLPEVLTQTAAIEEANKATLGIVHAYDESPDEIRYWPCTVRYSRTGSREHSQGLGKKTIHYFIVEIHFERGRPGGLIECEKRARAVVDPFMDLYAAHLTLNGTCNTSGFGDPAYEYGRLEWAGTETIGVRFNLWAKVMGGLTVSL